MLTIGRLARRFSLSRSTLLYYDSIGLLRPSGRSPANYRLYTERDRRRLELICRYREAGVPMLPVVAGTAETRRQIWIYSLLLVPLTLTPQLVGMAGWLYTVGAAALGVWFLALAWRVRRAEDGEARAPRRLFAFSILYLFLIFALLAFEMFNFDTTRFALESLLGEVRFAGIAWATILAVAFCAIDFAGLGRLFTPEEVRDEMEFVFVKSVDAAIEAVLEPIAASDGADGEEE